MPTPSGWYPDPLHDTQARFFDGRAWTRWTVGMPATPAPVVGGPPPGAAPAAQEGLGWLFLSLNGRANRSTWWLGAIILTVAYTAGMFLLGGLSEGNASSSPIMTSGLILYLVAAVASWMVNGKRWHDRGKSAAWNLIGLIPVVGALWAFIELGFVPGTAGPNAYGEEPS